MAVIQSDLQNALPIRYSDSPPLTPSTNLSYKISLFIALDLIKEAKSPYLLTQLFTVTNEHAQCQCLVMHCELDIFVSTSG